MTTTEYEAVIGLEVHVQLGTASKMFTGVPYVFGQAPNSLTDPVVLALPGALPVLNREAIERTIRVGLLFGCQIAEVCKWDRKNYWYPDSPKNYQISQYDQPICLGGEVEIELPGPSRNVMGPHRSIQLTRIHLEEDVGKLTHAEGDSLVDYNRAGTPLIEIVTEPDLHSAEEAFAFLTALRMALTSAGISHCDMEKGEMRCDANISVRPVGQQELGTKVELKNLNTISGVRNGVDYEIRRQIALCRESRAGEIVQETRRWNAEANYTTAMRGKEQSHDYRYFPDPDLMPLRVEESWLRELRDQVPELPFDRQRRYQREYELPYTITSVLCPDRALCDYFEQALALGGDPKTLANFVANDLLRSLGEVSAEGESRRSAAEATVTPAHLAELVHLIDSGVISSQIAKELFPEMARTGELPAAIVDRKGLKQSTDSGEIERICAEAITANPKPAEEFRSGNEKAINAIKGQVMKATRGKANPKLVDEILRKLLRD